MGDCGLPYTGVVFSPAIEYISALYEQAREVSCWATGITAGILLDRPRALPAGVSFANG
ncbi:MAG: hypothetical protein FMNOHCHN_01642 [Ignavibacteriaceae bacterium]|nr:hypothetical protein [Ignavibacteriaceae bacterium]